MVIKHKDMLPIVLKDRNAPAAKNFGTMHLDDPSLYNFSEKNILFMIQAADTLVKDDRKPASFHANSIYKNARGLFVELHTGHLERDEEQFPNFVLFVDTNLRRTKIISHSMKYLFLSTMHPLHYDARDKLKKMEAKQRSPKADFG